MKYYLFLSLSWKMCRILMLTDRQAIVEEYVSKPSIATPLMQFFRLLTGLELPMMHAY